MSKVIVTEMGDTVTEHWGKTFKEVMSQLTVPATVYLDHYKEDEPGFKVFNRRLKVGNTAENLTQDDFWQAWDLVDIE